MRKVVTALLTCTALALPAVPAASAASAQTVTAVYVCDGNGAGSCMSLEPGATPAHGEHLISVGKSAGSWRWVEGTESQVGDGIYTFSYGPLENQLQGQPVHVFDLNGSTAFCAANSAGGAVINPCSSALDQAWVFDPTTHTLVNMGRSNDKNNWEVLCNPGTGDQLLIGTRDSCSTYHETWGVVSSSALPQLAAGARVGLHLCETFGSFCLGAPTVGLDDPVVETGHRLFNFNPAGSGEEIQFVDNNSLCVAAANNGHDVVQHPCNGGAGVIWHEQQGPATTLFENNEFPGKYLSGANNGTQFQLKSLGASGWRQQFTAGT